MEVVLPSGAVTRMGGQTVKNVVGYDLTSFFCGSEGSLGVITSMTLRVVPKPPAEKLLIMGFKSRGFRLSCHESRYVPGAWPGEILHAGPLAESKNDGIFFT